MYTCKFITPTILEVHEQLMSFNRTVHTYWYYDIEHWLHSCNGYKDEPALSHMSSGQIEWAKQYYIPKAKEYQS